MPIQRRRPGWAAILSLAFGLAPSTLTCSTDDHTIKASAYNRRCSTDQDCVPVFEGTIGCCGPSCPNTAINASDQPRYTADVNARRPICNPQPPCPLFTAELCGSKA